MIQRLLILIFIYTLIAIMPLSNNGNDLAHFFINKIYAQESLKINNINFDNSDSIIFLGTSGSENEIKITKKVLSEPDRTFFDIENAVITFPNSTFELKNSRLSKVKIAQNSTNPNIVRVVIWNSPTYDASQIKVLQINNNLIIKLSNEIPLQQYLTQIYKETKESSVEYYDKAVVIPEEKPSTESDEIFNKVQEAFKEEDQQIVRPNIEQKQARLKSRFFLEKVVPKNGNVLLSGIGVINVEKPIFLTEPSRIVFDLPNTIVLQELRDKEFILNDKESVRIGQFEPSKARIVIKTPNPQNYIPIYSTSLQTLLIANENNISSVNISNTLSELAYFNEQNINPTTDVINIMFSNPIIYSIEKENGFINLTFYNLNNFNVESFNNIAQANKTGFNAKRLNSNTYKLSFPINSSTLVDCYETLNATQLRFVFTKKLLPAPSKDPIISIPVQEPQSVRPTPKKEGIFSELIEKPKKKPQKEQTTVSSKIKNKVVVIDAGHGGLDTGALRGATTEKEITLNIAKKVKTILKEAGMKKVILTRSEDKTLALDERVQIANDKKANIFVSIHINASVKTEIKGIETHYYSQSGYEVAKVIHKELIENINSEDRGLFKSKFYVINHTKAPAVLLELGFISNDQERTALTSDKRQTDSAQAIADGIINYLLEQ
ncbi:MAG: AMIN domain-containing protein [Cyanobacteria bacterium SIG29]|nr:AMIN domain-containing protein [Cyanobacteria bacterium SIG29]